MKNPILFEFCFAECKFCLNDGPVPKYGKAQLRRGTREKLKDIAKDSLFSSFAGNNNFGEDNGKK